MLRLAHELLGERRPAAIGVSFGGPVLQSQGLVILSHHIPGWENTPLAAQLEAEFGAPAAIANDANIGALGEWRYGAAQGCASVFYVTVSTGIGGGWVLNGAIYDGADGMAGEIGHVVVNHERGGLCLRQARLPGGRSLRAGHRPRRPRAHGRCAAAPAPACSHWPAATPTRSALSTLRRRRTPAIRWRWLCSTTPRACWARGWARPST